MLILSHYCFHISCNTTCSISVIITTVHMSLFSNLQLLAPIFCHGWFLLHWTSSCILSAYFIQLAQESWVATPVSSLSSSSTILVNFLFLFVAFHFTSAHRVLLGWSGKDGDELFQSPVDWVHTFLLRFQRYTHCKSPGSISENRIPSFCN